MNTPELGRGHITEGNIKKGGVNRPPETPKQEIRPPGQRGPVSERPPAGGSKPPAGDGERALFAALCLGAFGDFITPHWRAELEAGRYMEFLIAVAIDYNITETLLAEYEVLYGIPDWHEPRETIMARKTP